MKRAGRKLCGTRFDRTSTGGNTVPTVGRDGRILYHSHSDPLGSSKLITLGIKSMIHIYLLEVGSLDSDRHRVDTASKLAGTCMTKVCATLAY